MRSVEVLSVHDADVPSMCRLDPGASAVLTHETVTEVGGADGISVGDATKMTIYVNDLGQWYCRPGDTPMSAESPSRCGCPTAARSGFESGQ